MEQDSAQILNTANATGQRFNPTLIKSYLDKGGTLSNNAIPLLSTDFPQTPVGSKTTGVVTSKVANDHVDKMSEVIKNSNTDLNNSQQTNTQNKQNTPPAKVDYGSFIPKEDLANFQKANPGLTFGPEDYKAYIDANKNKPEDDTTKLLNTLTGNLNSEAKPDATQQDVLDTDKTQNTIDEKNLKIVSDAIDSMNAGTYPLTATESASVANVAKQFEAAFKASQELTTNKIGGQTVQNAKYGGQMYSPNEAVSKIAGIIKTGNEKIAEINTKLIDAQDKLTQAFKDQDFKTATSLYNKISDTIKERRQEISDINKDVAAATKQMHDDYREEVTKPINDIALTAAKNGADPKIISAIKASGNVQDAIVAAGNSLQTASGTLGDYLQYKRDAESKGLVPKDFQSYKDEQDAKAIKLKASEAYATKSAQNEADANNSVSDKVQQKLEQQYRQVLSKEFSARTGALGVENGKVNQANHLNSLFTQYYNPKTGNYDIPTSQYNELALGLANLVSPGGVASDSLRNEINQKTAKGDFAGAVAYITGQPQTGNTQAMIKNIVDSVDRQAQTAVRNREAALQNMRDQAPTDLDPTRIDKLNKSTEMVGYEGQHRISKASVDGYVKSHPDSAEEVAKLYEVPGATDEDIEAYLKAQGKLQ